LKIIFNFIVHCAGPLCNSWIRYFGNPISFSSATAQVCVHADAMFDELSVITNCPVSHCFFSFILGKTRIVRHASVMAQNFFGAFLATPHPPPLLVETGILTRHILSLLLCHVHTPHNSTL